MLYFQGCLWQINIMERNSDFNLIFNDLNEVKRRRQFHRELAPVMALCVVRISKGGMAYTQRVFKEIRMLRMILFLNPEKSHFDLAPAQLLIKTSLHIVYTQHSIACINFMLQ